MFEYLTLKWTLVVGIIVILNVSVFIGSFVYAVWKDKKRMRKFLKSLRPQGKAKK